MMRVAFYLFLDTINKNLEVSKVLQEEIVQFDLGHWHSSVMTSFVLEPLLDNQPTQKQSCKWNFVPPFVFGGLKIVFVLLAESIAIYVQITIVRDKNRALKGCLRGSRSTSIWPGTLASK